MSRLSGTILITSATSGIGRACATRLVSDGASVVLWGRDIGRMHDMAGELGSAARCQQVELTNEAQVKGALAQLKSDGVPLYGLVHAAGMHAIRPLILESESTLVSLLEANVGTVFRLTRLALAMGLLRGPGSIVTVSSQAAVRGTAGAAGYAATKGALEAAVRSWAVELARRKLRVNAVSPGVVRTPMTDRYFAALGKEQQFAIEGRHLLGLGDPIDVAAAVAFLISEDARWITGSVLSVDGGFSCW